MSFFVKKFEIFDKIKINSDESSNNLNYVNKRFKELRILSHRDLIDSITEIDLLNKNSLDNKIENFSKNYIFKDEIQKKPKKPKKLKFKKETFILPNFDPDNIMLMKKLLKKAENENKKVEIKKNIRSYFSNEDLLNFINKKDFVIKYPKSPSISASSPKNNQKKFNFSETASNFFLTTQDNSKVMSKKKEFRSLVLNSEESYFPYHKERDREKDRGTSTTRNNNNNNFLDNSFKKIKISRKCQKIYKKDKDLDTLLKEIEINEKTFQNNFDENNKLNARKNLFTRKNFENKTRSERKSEILKKQYNTIQSKFFNDNKPKKSMEIDLFMKNSLKREDYRFSFSNHHKESLMMFQRQLFNEKHKEILKNKK